MEHKAICFAISLSLAAPALAAASGGPNDLSFGATFPQGVLAAEENAAALAIGKSDELAVFSPLPWQYDRSSGELSRRHLGESPITVGFSAHASPFGIGFVGTSGTNPDVYGGLGCGNDQIQFGYSYHVNAQSQSSANNLSLRVGGANTHALTILWGDERKAISAGFVFGWLYFDLDAATSSLADGFSSYQATAGVRNDFLALNIGRTAAKFGDLSESNASQHLGIGLRLRPRFAATLYYGRFNQQLLAGLTMSF